MFLQQAGGHTGTLNQPAGEAAVIDLPPAAGGAPLLQHRQGAPMGPGQLQHLFGSEAVRLRHVLSRPVHFKLVGVVLHDAHAQPTLL